MKKSATVRMNDKGRIVIPEAIRESLGLKDGELLDIVVERSKQPKKE